MNKKDVKAGKITKKETRKISDTESEIREVKVEDDKLRYWVISRLIGNHIVEKKN